MSSSTKPRYDSILIGDCLRCVAEGKLIAHDWEFQTLFGLEPHEVQSVAHAWPQENASSEVVDLAVNNSLAVLGGLVSSNQLVQHVGYTSEEIFRTLELWRGARENAERDTSESGGGSAA